MERVHEGGQNNKQYARVHGRESAALWNELQVGIGNLPEGS